MKKKVIGIILVVIAAFTLFVSVVLLATFGLLGGAFGMVGNNLDLEVDGGSTVETVEGTIISTDDNQTTIMYEVDGNTYVGTLNIHNSAYTADSTVMVEYDSLNPGTFAVPELGEVFGTLGGIFVIVAIVVGVLGIGAGVAMLIVGIVLIKKAKKAQQAATA